METQNEEENFYYHDIELSDKCMHGNDLFDSMEFINAEALLEWADYIATKKARIASKTFKERLFATAAEHLISELHSTRKLTEIMAISLAKIAKSLEAKNNNGGDAINKGE